MADVRRRRLQDRGGVRRVDGGEERGKGGGGGDPPWRPSCKEGKE